MSGKSVPTADSTAQRKARSPLVRVLVLIVLMTLGWIGFQKSRTDYYIRHGSESIKNRQSNQAQHYLTQAIGVDPKNPEAHFLLARLARHQGHLEEMNAHLLQAKENGCPVEKLEREQWLTHAQVGNMEQAEQHLSELLQNPRGDGAEICEAYVQGYFLNYDLSEAFQLLRGWEADFPTDPQPYVFRGAYANHLGNTAEESRAYQKALNLAPWRDDIRKKLLSPLLDLHQYDEVDKHVQNLLESHPDQPDLIAIQGQCFIAQGRQDEARSAYEKALQIEEDHFEARLGLAQFELEQRHPEAALKWLEPLAIESPHDLEVQYALANAYQRLGQEGKAEIHFQFVTDARKAIKMIRTLIEDVKDDSSSVEKRFQIGKLLTKFGPPNEAVNWLQSALKYAPKHEPTLQLLVEHYEKNGDQKLSNFYRQSIEN